MKEYDRIAAKAQKMLHALPEAYQAAFYELVYYPVKGADLMNKKMLTAQKAVGTPGSGVQLQMSVPSKLKSITIA